MIFFYGEGRLGNQVFQYQALCAIARPRETIFAAGLESLPELFEIGGPRLRILTRNRFLKRLIKFLLIPFIVRPAVRSLRLANYVYEPLLEFAGRAQPGGEMSFRSGLLGRLTFVDGGHYQNPSLWHVLFPAAALALKAPVRDAARRLLSAIPSAAGGLSFVHVRRGDYLNYKVYGVDDVCLPAGFYRAAIAELRRRVGETHLVFITDDPGWVAQHLGDIRGQTILSSDASMDFAVMTECSNGIISNSTFSLAAAFIMANPGVVIAPQYWYGFSAGTWYPPKIRCEHAKLVYVGVPG
jgi:Glycosyl transferase family 11